jgi:putative thioredoxin
MTDRFANSQLPDPAKAQGGGDFVVEVDGEEAFRALAQRSAQVPVVIDLWADWCEPCKQLSPILEKVTRDLGGRVLLAKIDVDKNQQIAAAFGAQSIPTVVALVNGQPVPLFQGAIPEPQVRQFFDELLKAAAQVGVTGTVTGAPPAEPPLPPLHQEGYDALERGDTAAAKEAFTKALAESPADHAAQAALAQVELLERLESGADAAEGADGPGASAAAVMAAADQDVASGNSARGFNRLLAAIAQAAPEDKEALRVRLVSLFEVAGDSDPAVAQARRRLAGLLF